AAEVEELPYAALGSHVMHHPADEGPVIADDSRHVRRHCLKLLRRLSVDGEIVLAAEQVIVNPGHIRPGYIDTVRRRILRRHLRRHSRFAMDATRDSAYAWGPCAVQSRECCSPPGRDPGSAGRRRWSSWTARPSRSVASPCSGPAAQTPSSSSPAPPRSTFARNIRLAPST